MSDSGLMAVLDYMGRQQEKELQAARDEKNVILSHQMRKDLQAQAHENAKDLEVLRLENALDRADLTATLEVIKQGIIDKRDEVNALRQDLNKNNWDLSRINPENSTEESSKFMNQLYEGLDEKEKEIAGKTGVQFEKLLNTLDALQEESYAMGKIQDLNKQFINQLQVEDSRYTAEELNFLIEDFISNEQSNDNKYLDEGHEQEFFKRNIPTVHALNEMLRKANYEDIKTLTQKQILANHQVAEKDKIFDSIRSNQAQITADLAAPWESGSDKTNLAKAKEDYLETEGNTEEEARKIIYMLREVFLAQDPEYIKDLIKDAKAAGSDSKKIYKKLMVFLKSPYLAVAKGGVISILKDINKLDLSVIEAEAEDVFNPEQFLDGLINSGNL